MSMQDKMEYGYRSIASDKKAGKIRKLTFGLVAGIGVGAGILGSNILNEYTDEPAEKVEIAPVEEVAGIKIVKQEPTLGEPEVKQVNGWALMHSVVPSSVAVTGPAEELFNQLRSAGANELEASTLIAMNTVYKPGTMQIDLEATGAHMKEISDSPEHSIRHIAANNETAEANKMRVKAVDSMLPGLASDAIGEAMKMLQEENPDLAFSMQRLGFD